MTAPRPSRPGAALPEPAQAHPSLRQRKKLQTFAALQTAARTLVAEHGLEHVSIEKIAAAAHVSVRTFFNYFDSKNAAVVDPPPHMTTMLAAALAAQPADLSPLHAWRAAILDLVLPQVPQLHQLTQLVAANPGLLPHHQAAYATFDEVIIDFIRTRTGVEPTGSAYPRMLARCVHSALDLALQRWQPESGPDGFRAGLDEVFSLLEHGLVTTPTRQASEPRQA